MFKNWGCLMRGIIETLTMPAFWLSLLPSNGALVVRSGCLWDHRQVWVEEGASKVLRWKDACVHCGKEMIY